ncbi:sugar transporter [Moraxella sp. FZLJ2107]|uniref:sugar transporter n=1 Tax=unclassified Moraxella TaxID=2685852 RepID=UPI0020C83588|nr:MULTISPECIES: sugar transporter [unclassified Moraxella]UTO05197.1 sugar transporter [Moraxella sp. FZLJ2107]UTO21932.1 sugar transporter [Moraxella sp. FZLJ2109]
MTNTNQSFLPVIILALSAFIFNTTEFIPIALLTDIGTSFGMTASQTGIMMTVYAWIVAVLSLPMMLATATIERKKLLLILFGLFAIGHIVSYLATSFTMLLVSRAIVAITHAVFWSITASLVVRLAPIGKETQALGLLSTGSALATVLGLPLGRVLGQALDWRTSFGMIGVIAMFIMLLLAYLLPRLPAKNSGNLSSLPSVINNKPLLSVYAMIVLTVTAHFTAYSYIEPFVLDITDFGADFATMTLLLFGAAGIVASILFGRYYEKLGDRFITIAFGGMLIGLVGLMPMADIQGIWTVLVFIWGVSLTALALSLQIRVLKLAPKATDVAMSIFSGIFNVGIGGGAMVGGLVIAGFGLPMIGYVGALILMGAVGVFLYRKKA